MCNCTLSFVGFALPTPQGSSVEDAIAMSMCVSTKTVALGIPIISAVYGGNEKAGLFSLPLIIYHAEQILIGAVGGAGVWVLLCGCVVGLRGAMTDGELLPPLRMP